MAIIGFGFPSDPCPVAADSEWVKELVLVLSCYQQCLTHFDHIKYIYNNLEVSGVSEVEDKMQVRSTSVAMATGSSVAVTVPRVPHFASCSIIRRVR